MDYWDLCITTSAEMLRHIQLRGWKDNILKWSEYKSIWYINFHNELLSNINKLEFKLPSCGEKNESVLKLVV